MSTHHHHRVQISGDSLGDVPTVRVCRDKVQNALKRLIQTGDPKAGARRLVQNASAHGIDLDLVWGVIDEHSQNQLEFRQVCMVVPGAGGTGMCFVSNPFMGKDLARFGDKPTQVHEIGAVLSATLRDLPRVAGDRIRIAQMLFEPAESWTHQVCQQAGMTSVGTLDYLRLDYGLVSQWTEPQEPWADGIRFRQIVDLDKEHELLAEALRASYEGTLDCPELCGMRSMEDVIASHRSTGVFDPRRWWLLLENDIPMGCCLLSHCPPNESVELVYIGLCKRLQGRGFGTRMLRHALGSLRIDGTVQEVTCAVDRRNIPASQVYLRLGFKRFDARCGYVRPV